MTTRDDLSPFRRDVYDLLQVEDSKAAERYLHCGEWLDYVQYCPECESNQPDFFARAIPRSCMLRICPECAKRLAAPIRNRYRPVIEHIMKRMPKSWSVKHVTLTRSIELSTDTVGAMSETLEMAGELVRRLVTRHRGAGAIVTGEIGETGHKVHAHLIVYSPFIAQAIISDTWREITGGDFVVWVRRLETPDAAVSEGLKYATKASHLAPAQLVNLHHELKGTRRVRSYGCFYMSKNNPLKALFDQESGSCTCPDCAARLTFAHVDQFLQMAGLHIGHPPADLEDALHSLRWLRAGLNSKEAIKFFRGPP